MSEARTVREREFTGWHMLALLFAFFGVTIAVNLTLAFYANKTWSGLVVANGYVASQQFNELLAESKREQALGWQSSFSLEGGRLEVVLSDKRGAPLPGFDLSVKFARPAHEGQDRTVTLEARGSGRYTADVPLAPGLWTAEMVASRDGRQELKRLYRFVVKP
jgi:nitrogen fixation protein FixH